MFKLNPLKLLAPALLSLINAFPAPAPARAPVPHVVHYPASAKPLPRQVIFPATAHIHVDWLEPAPWDDAEARADLAFLALFGPPP